VFIIVNLWVVIVVQKAAVLNRSEETSKKHKGRGLPERVTHPEAELGVLTLGSVDVLALLGRRK
jgi:hypothetical protein